MKAIIQDNALLGSRNPRSIRLYLSTTGWQREGSSTVWRLANSDSEFEVSVPNNNEVRDYPRRVWEVVTTLAAVEQRSELDVIRDLGTTSYDVQYLQRQSATMTGTTPITGAVSAYKNAQALMVAAAHSTVNARAVHPQRRSVEANQMIQRVLAGPTSEGSFVMSVLTPIAPRLTQAEDLVLFDSAGDPFERLVTRTLYQAVAAAQHAANLAYDSDAGLQPFLDAVPSGVSANLCEALVGIAGEDNELRVAFGWALDRAVPSSPPVRFGAHLIPVLESAALELRASVPEQGVVLRGDVVRLRREHGQGNGDVTIAGVFDDDDDGLNRRVTVNLSAPDYEQAIAAHQQGEMVLVTGNVVRRGTRTSIEQTTQFVRIPN